MRSLPGEQQPDRNFYLGCTEDVHTQQETVKYSFCHRLEIKSFLEDKSQLKKSLLQKLIIKALYPVAKHSQEKYDPNTFVFQAFQKCIKLPLVLLSGLKAHHMQGTGARSRCLAFTQSSFTRFLNGLFLNSCFAVNVTCEISGAKLQVGGRHVESGKGVKNIVL